MQDTLAACKNFKYNLIDGTEIKFANFESVTNDAKKTTLHVDTVEHVPRMFLVMDKIIKTAIVVVNVDCLKEAIRLKDEGYNPAVLNMASPRRPGERSLNIVPIFLKVESVYRKVISVSPNTSL